MSVQTLAPLCVDRVRRPVVVSTDDLIAPRVAASTAAAVELEVAASESIKHAEPVTVSAARVVALVGSAAFAGWTSLACFVC